MSSLESDPGDGIPAVAGGIDAGASKKREVPYTSCGSFSHSLATTPVPYNLLKHSLVDVQTNSRLLTCSTKQVPLSCTASALLKYWVGLYQTILLHSRRAEGSIHCLALIPSGLTARGLSEKR